MSRSVNEREKNCRGRQLREASHLGSAGKQIKGTAFLPRVESNAISLARTGHGDIGDADETET